MQKVVWFTCWWLPLTSALAPTCNFEPLHFIPNPPPKGCVIFPLPILLTNCLHFQLVLGVIISVNNHLIWYRHAHFQDLHLKGLYTNWTSLKYIYIYLLSHSFLHVLWFPLIEFVPLMGLVQIPLSWRRAGGWWPPFTWVFFSHHASTTVNWFGFNCTQQVLVLICVLAKQITMNLVQFTVQFEQQTKSPVASNSAGVMQVIQVKWNLCLHFLHRIHKQMICNVCQLEL